MSDASSAPRVNHPNGPRFNRAKVCQFGGPDCEYHDWDLRFPQWYKESEQFPGYWHWDVWVADTTASKLRGQRTVILCPEHHDILLSQWTLDMRLDVEEMEKTDDYYGRLSTRQTVPQSVFQRWASRRKTGGASGDRKKVAKGKSTHRV